MPNRKTESSQGYNKHPECFSPKVRPENIPKQIKDNCRWCVWKAKKREKSDGTTKTDKIPMNANGRISTAKPNLWMKYEDAIGLYEESIKDSGEYIYNGIGILVRDIICVDIDGTTDLGEWEWVDTYIEYSPSCEGLRIIGDGWTNFDIAKPVEIYSGNAPRFVTITGNVYGDCKDKWEDIGDFCNDIVMEHKSNVIEAEQVDASQLPTPLKFEKQDWWLTNLTFPQGSNRSNVLFGWSKTLISRGLTDIQIFSIYMGTPEIIEMAKSHRRGKLDKAQLYLWKDILKAKAKWKLEQEVDGAEFADFADDELDHLLEEKERQDDKYKYVEKQVLQDWNKEVAVVLPDLKRLKSIYRNSVYDGKRNKFYTLDKHGFIRTYNKIDYLSCELNLQKILGKIEGPADEVKEFIKTAKNAFAEGVMKHRQVDSRRARIDMFINQPIIIRENTGTVKVIIPHNEYPVDKSAISSEIISRYKQHFPYYDDFLEFLVACRFASNRRKAYLFIKAGSSWGKGFLNGVFKSIGKTEKDHAVLPLNDKKELANLLSGSPSGVDLDDYIAHLMIHIDEVNHVLRDYKKLDDTITGAAKNKLRTTIDVYAKVFTSAQEMQGLIGDHGVEKQFANRFCYYPNLKDNIEEVLIDKYEQNIVFNAVKNHTASELNRLIENYRKLGREKAKKEADQSLNRHYQKYKITNFHHALEDSLPELAENLIKKINDVVFDDTYIWVNNGDRKLYHRVRESCQYGTAVIDKHQFPAIRITQPNTNVKELCYLLTGKVEGTKLVVDVEEIMNHMSLKKPYASQDGTWFTPHNGKKEKVKGLFIPSTGIKDFEDQ